MPAFLDYYARSAGYGFWAAIERSNQPWPDYIPGEEEGDVEYALLRSEWEEQAHR